MLFQDFILIKLQIKKMSFNKGNKMIFEVCVDSITSAVAAERGGADRIEVCDNLVEGGTTPSIGLIKIIRKNLKIEMNSIIRPRGGDFLYTADEFEVMQADVEAVKEVG
jgi:copper homeostasis protein